MKAIRGFVGILVLLAIGIFSIVNSGVRFLQYGWEIFKPHPVSIETHALMVVIILVFLFVFRVLFFPK